MFYSTQDLQASNTMHILKTFVSPKTVEISAGISLMKGFEKVLQSLFREPEKKIPSCLFLGTFYRIELLPWYKIGRFFVRANLVF